MTTYQSLFIEEVEEKKFEKSVKERRFDDLPEGEVLIKVHYSSLNFKDALSASGNKAVTRNFPHQPGIDAAGVVEMSSSDDFAPDEQVIVTGYDLGMNTAGGLGQYIRVPSKWVIKLPKAMSLKQSMQFGTAGLTAALCIDKLEKNGVTPEQGQVLVTGATGGVGCIAVALLANAGYDVVASSGKSEQTEFLTSLGANEVIDRSELSEENKRPLLKERFAAAVDVAGGETLSNILKSIKAGGSVSCCGLVASADLNTSVLPFILRGVNLLGVDSVEIPLAEKQKIWSALAEVSALPAMEKLNEEITLADVPGNLDRILAGGMIGHIVVNMQSV